MASVGLSKPQWMLHGLRGCGMASVSVTLLQWVWNGLSGCSMVSVGALGVSG